jgi:spore coat protein U-like protein
VLKAYKSIVFFIFLFPSLSDAACSFSNVGGINFGVYSTFSSTADDTNGSVRLRCSPRASVVVSLSTGASGSYANRAMTSTAGTLNYNIYTTAARTSIWGNGASGTSVVSASNINNRKFTLFSRIFALQDVSVGNYTDSIVVTATF